jgi:hypothetical protein
MGGMKLALEYIGKFAATFDVCVISFVLGIVATVLLVGRVQKWLKLPDGHWAITPLIFAGSWITLNVGFALAKWVWTLELFKL